MRGEAGKKSGGRNVIQERDFVNVFDSLGVTRKRIMLHSSLRNVGAVDGGAHAVLNSIRESVATCVMAGFSFESVVAPPVLERPARNGIDYAKFRTLVIPTPRFCIENAPVDRKMGVVASEFAKMDGIHRSDHPWLSYSAWGDGSIGLTEPHPWESGSLPIKNLVESESYLVLLGVTLPACSALHVSCELAGRKNFIRWALDRQGNVRRLRAGGCSKGFDNLLPVCRSLFRADRIGGARIMVAHLPTLVEVCRDAILEDPEITRCSPECSRCHDAILGGPLE